MKSGQRVFITIQAKQMHYTLACAASSCIQRTVTGKVKCKSKIRMEGGAQLLNLAFPNSCELFINELTVHVLFT